MEVLLVAFSERPQPLVGVVELDRLAIRRCRRQVELGVLQQDALVQLLQRPAGFDPELIDEDRSGIAVGSERLGRPLGPVEREHPLGPEVLAQRPPAGEVVELGDDLGVPTEREVGVDATLDRLQPFLLEPSDLAQERRFVGEVGERRSTPETERSPNQTDAPRGSPSTSAFARADVCSNSRASSSPGPTMSR